MESNSTRVVALFFFLGLCTTLLGQTHRKDTFQLNTILIYWPRLPDTLAKYNATTISKKELRQFDGLNIAPVINQIPGVHLQQGALNTNRIIIRGIGSRTPFSSNRIKAYINNIPISSANGETVIEDLDLHLFSQVVLHKNARPEFGSTLGGTFIYKTPSSFAKRFSHEQTVGSFGLLSTSSSLSFHQNKSSVAVSYNQLRKDGYRENSKYRRDGFNFLGKQGIGEKNILNIFIQYTDLEAFIPSALNENDFLNSPQNAAFTWGSAQGFESYKRSIGGIDLTTSWNDKFSSSISLFSQFNDGYEPRPFNILDENYDRFGARLKTNWHHKIQQREATLIIGSEVLFEDVEIRTFENLYRDFPNQGSIQGNQLSNQLQKLKSFNYFVQESISWNKKVFGLIGLNVNRSSYSLNSPLPNKSTSLPSSISPLIEINYKKNEQLRLYGIWSYGYSNPSFSNAIDSDGNFNNELAPEKGRNLELGGQFYFIKELLQVKLAAYQINLNDLIVNTPTSNNQFIITNAGKVKNRGIELSVIADFPISDEFKNVFQFNASFNQFRFDSFRDAGIDFGGNKLTGTPNQIINISNELHYKNKLFLFIQLYHLGAIPLDDENSLFSDAYSLVNLQLSYKKTITKRLHFLVKAGVNNVLNTNHAVSILPNAVSFGNSSPRYFYPGDAINYFGKLSVQYDFN